MEFLCDFTDSDRDYPVAQCVSLIDFAARGVGHHGVTVWLRYTRCPSKKDRRKRKQPAFSGLALDDTEVRLRLGPPQIIPAYIVFIGWGELKGRFPYGIPCDGWRDMLVFLAAHEFRHIWQYRRLRRKKPVPTRIEEDANEHGVKILNCYRLLTGREELGSWP